MNTLRVLLTLCALLALTASASAQTTHPCDATVATTATITQNVPHKIQFCSLESDKVEAAIAFVDGVPSALQPVTAVSAKSTSGRVLYETALFLSVNNRGQHSLQVSAYNRDAAGVAQEGPKSAPFVFAVDAEFALSLSLTADKASPQPTSTGTITLTATAQGGVAPYSFKWFINGGLWVPWTTAANGGNVKLWTPSVGGPGTYTIEVWARSSDLTADTPEAKTTLTYVITVPPVPPPGAPVIVGVTR